VERDEDTLARGTDLGQQHCQTTLETRLVKQMSNQQSQIAPRALHISGSFSVGHHDAVSLPVPEMMKR
jgi:hypothetical protein